MIGYSIVAIYQKNKAYKESYNRVYRMIKVRFWIKGDPSKENTLRFFKIDLVHQVCVRKTNLWLNEKLNQA
jgi:hypothetical protein